MTELEHLLQQKKQLEQKIKELKNGSLICCGISKFEIDPNDHKYRLSIAGKQTRTRYESKIAFENRCGKNGYYYCDRKAYGTYDQDFWYTIIRTEDKQKAMECVDQIINDFIELRKKLIEEGEESV